MEFLSKEQIIFNTELTERDKVIEAISQKAFDLGITDNKKGLVESFIVRENLGTTAFGDGLAIPHAKSDYVNNVAIIIVKSEVPIEWASLDGTPVFIAISLLVPENNPDNIHLKVLSSISRKLINEEFKSALLNCKNADELLSLFEGIVIN